MSKVKKYFTIHANDAGSEAYDTAYVLSLEEEIKRIRKVVIDTAGRLEAVIDDIHVSYMPQKSIGPMRGDLDNLRLDLVMCARKSLKEITL